jgi:predicted nucleic acid-binding protein
MFNRARLADEIIVPSAVARELTHPSTPQRVRAWLAHPPNRFSVTAPTTIDPSLDLGPGESEAISLALELGARSILIDGRKGFRAAVQRGLQPIGLLAVLEFSAANGWIDFEDHIARLRSSTFRLNERLLTSIRERLDSRKA